jgi:hypothetical protein
MNHQESPWFSTTTLSTTPSQAEVRRNYSCRSRPLTLNRRSTIVSGWSRLALLSLWGNDFETQMFHDVPKIKDSRFKVWNLVKLEQRVSSLWIISWLFGPVWSSARSRHWQSFRDNRVDLHVPSRDDESDSEPLKWLQSLAAALQHRNSTALRWELNHFQPTFGIISRIMSRLFLCSLCVSHDSWVTLLTPAGATSNEMRCPE